MKEATTTARSNTVWLIRLIAARPMSVPTNTTGASQSVSSNVVGGMSPIAAENGVLERFTRRKNHALVPTNVRLSTRAKSKYSAMTGPAALAVIVVNPAAVPAPHATAVFIVANSTPRDWRRIIHTCSPTDANNSTPMARRITRSSISHMNRAPSAIPGRIAGSIRRIRDQSADLW